jgi:glycosyltransferase involved in cell wall biosynthesis
MADIKVSAIVSTYNSEDYFAGCLADLTGQTLFEKGQMEIIVIDSGSQQEEREVYARHVAIPYKERLKYIRTEERETLYAAWNRGITEASGMYITNANTDDRHSQYFCERYADILDRHADVGVVYGAYYETKSYYPAWYLMSRGSVPVKSKGVFDDKLQFERTYGAPFAMWRKSLHNAHGMFDGTFKVAGDGEFFLRLGTAGVKFYYVGEPLGLYFRREGSLEHGNPDVLRREREIFRSRYR